MTRISYYRRSCLRVVAAVPVLYSEETIPSPPQCATYRFEWLYQI
ncbi:MAG: hypothetical protein ACFNYM_07695 [Bacteroidota bacterium]